MKVIGLCGYAGSGKDYVYSALDRHLSETTLRVALADEVRHEVETIVNGGRYLPTVWEKPYPVEVRRLLQWWGTDLRRSEDEDYWVNKTAETIEGIEREGDTDIVVVTDVRFGNEADMIRSFDGFVFEVLATPEVRTERIGQTPAHASEVIDFLTDGIILNSGHPTLDFLGARYLDLDPLCFRCRTLQAHPFHDNGTENLNDTSDFSGPAH